MFFLLPLLQNYRSRFCGWPMQSAHETVRMGRQVIREAGYAVTTDHGGGGWPSLPMPGLPGLPAIDFAAGGASVQPSAH